MFLSDDQIRMANSSPSGTNGAGLVGGSGGKTNARFYWHASKDGKASTDAGRTIYREAVFIMLWAEGATDSASHEAGDEDKRAFPREWAEFQEQQKTPVHPVQYLPGFTACHRRYCEDAQLFTVEALVEAEVQPELSDLQDMGRRWLALLKPQEAAEKAWSGRGRKPGSRNRPKAPPLPCGEARP